jgi:hypothetical protein
MLEHVPSPQLLLHEENAALAQIESQAVLQQKASMLHTLAQHATSSHPGDSLDEKQSPLPGQPGKVISTHSPLLHTRPPEQVPHESGKPAQVMFPHSLSPQSVATSQSSGQVTVSAKSVSWPAGLSTTT